MFFGPVFERLIRGAKARSPVDQRGTAHRPALEDGDRTVLAHAPDAFLIEAGVGLILEHLEVAAGLEWAFFDEQYLVACGAEDFGGGSAAGTAADDRHIRFEGQVLAQLGTVVGFPATGQAFAERIGYGHRQVLLLLCFGCDGEAPRSQTVGGPGYPQCTQDSARLYHAIITICSNEL